MATLNDDEIRAWGGFLRTHARIVRELDEELRAAHGMPLGTFDVLVNLALAPEQMLRMRDLADAIVLSRSGLTRLVDRLVRQGLVERRRCGEDARGAWAVLTPEGRHALAEASPTHFDGVRRRFLSALDGADQARLGDLWDKLRAEDLTVSHSP
jgi:DNA-binding MarR family transcriptional regulator